MKGKRAKAAKEPAKPGRPSIYTPALAARFCTMIAEGNSLRTICVIDGMPSVGTVWSWLDNKPEFLKQYARAREEQAEKLAQEIVSIADELTPDAAAAARNRLRVDARKWVAAKLKPKVYGERTAVEHSGVDGSPIQSVMTLEPSEAYKRMLG